MSDKNISENKLEGILDRETLAKIQPGLQVRSLDDEFVGDVVGVQGRYLELRQEGQSRWISLEEVRSADEVAVYLRQNAHAVRKAWHSSKPQS
ncbi:DUF2171 domain-containing protein [Meiothermus granaticius]|uniref:DUF2171 domain-containing protein n=1 Tax=Meiothermus granaticius NBRC 107808 TaxID=1227551 RepID=A0A399F966_9DEIN|nr:DUF2171 domain-containing protein [Meiothermus granaticius]RIH91452.1 hypothetical protein Mgrana_02629 [Meiothermus granaticius NBRC 107808]GEM87863.1 hypothetical protein MGR01S_24880 [Meiothermus granaticius NBRC 107808]